MRFLTVIWDDGEGENVEHIAEHGLTPDDVEDVLNDPDSVFDVSRSTGRPIAFGYTRTGRYIAVVYEELDPLTVYPLTAYDAREPGA